MEQKYQTDKYLVPGLLRGLAVLELFTGKQQTLALKEIADALEINRSSAFRLTYTLEHAGYLRKDAQGNYSLDSKVMQLGYSLLARMSLTDIAQPIMTELRDQTALATHLAVLNHKDLVYIANVQALGTFTSNIYIGARWPAYCTVIGQILLSALTEEEVRLLFENHEDWKIYSSTTPANVDELIKRLAFVKTQDYVISWGKYKPDMVACAAPILNRSTLKPIAALSVSCPINMFTQETFERQIVPKILEAANKISNFFY